MLYLSLTIIDFGLLVLAWLVQMIIYPSFQYTERSQLIQWHKKYQQLISFFVIPLMFSQVGISCYLLFTKPSPTLLLHFTLIIVIWFSTFLQAVPVHQKIANEEALKHNVAQLEKVNLLRTILWTFTFLLSIISLIQNIQLGTA